MSYILDALTKAGYPAKADMAAFNYPMVILLLTILVLYVTMVYGPIAAWLGEKKEAIAAWEKALKDDSSSKRDNERRRKVTEKLRKARAELKD